MAVNKVEINGVVKLDLTQDTVTPDTLLKDTVAHDASGARIVGTMARGAEMSIAVTTKAGAVCTATKGTITVSGTADADGNCTLTVMEAGTWTVSATSGTVTKQQDVVVGTSSVSIEFISAVLNDNDWETIRAVSDRGEGANYWSIGDRKAVMLNGTVGALSLSNLTTYVFIIGFNHNSSVEGANRIHFQLAKTALSGGTDVTFCDRYYETTSGGFRMNTSSTNSGGWNASNMRKNICGTSLTSYSGTILAVIPATLRAVLKSVTKYTDNTGYSSAVNTVTATTDYFFLLSEYEVFGSISYGNTNEKRKQVQYSYYSAGNSKVKYKHSATGTAAFWRLRTPSASDSNRFVIVDSGGKSGYNSAHYSDGFAPGFCV